MKKTPPPNFQGGGGQIKKHGQEDQLGYTCKPYTGAQPSGYRTVNMKLRTRGSTDGMTISKSYSRQAVNSLFETMTTMCLEIFIYAELAILF